MIYKDGKIECGKLRASVSATLDTATIPGTIQTQMTAISHPASTTPTPRVAVMVACHENFLGPSWIMTQMQVKAEIVSGIFFINLDLGS